MRVTNSMIYGNALSQMQSSLADFMESNIQGGTQKKINKPSDDPAGAAQVLNIRADIASTVQYQTNVDTARGWLEMTDATLQQVSTTITSIKSLTEQAATETMTPENRQQIGYQIEELFGQLLNLSNQEFNNNSLFAGHKYGETAYEMGLNVSTTDTDFDKAGVSITGSSESSMAVRFLSTGTVGVDTLDYEWSNDNGVTWNTGTLTPTESSITMEGVTMNMRPGTTVKESVRTDDEIHSDDGTYLFVHPTAVYQGDTNNDNAHAQVTGGPDGMQASITGDIPDNTLLRIDNAAPGANLRDPGSIVEYSISTDGGTTWTAMTAQVSDPADGSMQLPFTDVNGDEHRIELTTSAPPASSILPNGMQIDMQPRRVDMLGGPKDLMLNAEGNFAQNTLVRIDQDADLTIPNNVVHYSYSTDNGNTWIQATSQTPFPPTDSVFINIPGGRMEIAAPDGGTTTIPAGSQMVVHPDRADLGYEIMSNTYVPVNQVGIDIFGGMYEGQTVEGPNIFQAVGELIAFCEFNNTDGISQALETITAAHEHILTEVTRVGGLVNRLDLAEDTLSFEKLDQEERLSYTEDIDLTELLNNLAKQELAYSTVLKSSSMIMQINLTKYV